MEAAINNEDLEFYLLNKDKLSNYSKILTKNFKFSQQGNYNSNEYIFAMIINKA